MEEDLLCLQEILLLVLFKDLRIHGIPLDLPDLYVVEEVKAYPHLEFKLLNHNLSRTSLSLPLVLPLKTFKHSTIRDKSQLSVSVR